MRGGASSALGIAWLALVATVLGHWWTAVAWIAGLMLIIATEEIIHQVKKAATGGGQ